MFAKHGGPHTIGPMNALEYFGMHVLTVLFFIGLAGSSIVVALSFVEDLMELFGE